MPLPGVELVTTQNPCLYSPAQIRVALTIAWALRRGRFLLCEAPRGG
jgi:hypothetical protein